MSHLAALIAHAGGMTRSKLLAHALIGMLLVLGSAVPRWFPPLDGPLHVSGPYRAPPTPYAAGHRGIDLPARPGEQVFAPVSGVVSFAGRVVDRQVLSIRIDARTVVTLEPLELPDAGLKVGELVHRGEEIGVAGSGGHCASECVHLGVRVDDAYVNPMRYFFAKPVLLPW